MTQLTIGDSSNIAAAEYDGAAGVLRIHFHNGGIYDYREVSQVEAEAFANASSPGRHFHAHIKSVKPWDKVG